MSPPSSQSLHTRVGGLTQDAPWVETGNVTGIVSKFRSESKGSRVEVPQGMGNDEAAMRELKAALHISKNATLQGDEYR